MAEIYWVTRLDAIKGLLTLMLILSGIITLGALFGVLCEGYKEGITKCKKAFKRSSIALIILSILVTLVPTTNDMYTIYGVGGTIDYIKSDSVAKQLPHKCIVALDKWLETQTKQD